MGAGDGVGAGVGVGRDVTQVEAESVVALGGEGVGAPGGDRGARRRHGQMVNRSRSNIERGGGEDARIGGVARIGSLDDLGAASKVAPRKPISSIYPVKACGWSAVTQSRPSTGSTPPV